MRSRILGYLSAIAGACWVTVVILLVSRNVILRETWLGFSAKIIDVLPLPVRNLVFQGFWLMFLVGWIVPSYFAIRNLAGPSKVQGKKPTTNDERPTTAP